MPGSGVDGPNNSFVRRLEGNQIPTRRQVSQCLIDFIRWLSKLESLGDNLNHRVIDPTASTEMKQTLVVPLLA